MFSKVIRVLYLYLVSFIFLMISIYAIINTVNKIATLAYSESSDCMWDDYKYDKYSDETYYGIQPYNCQYDNSNREIRDIVTSVFTFIVTFGLFTFHWKKIEVENVIFIYSLSR